jgi:hypothetical protein
LRDWCRNKAGIPVARKIYIGLAWDIEMIAEQVEFRPAGAMPSIGGSELEVAVEMAVRTEMLDYRRAR